MIGVVNNQLTLKLRNEKAIINNIDKIKRNKTSGKINVKENNKTEDNCYEVRDKDSTSPRDY